MILPCLQPEELVRISLGGMDRSALKRQQMERAQAWCSDEGAAAHGNVGVERSPPQTAPSHVISKSHVAKSTTAAPMYKERSSLQTSAPSALLPNGGGGALEGPLPSAVRQIVQSACLNEASSDQADVLARRVISGMRRSRMYEAELRASRDEEADISRASEQGGIVEAALSQELVGIDARIAELQREREICLAQREQQRAHQAKLDRKAAECSSRTGALRSALDELMKETQRMTIMLRQLVPNLNVSSYVE